MSPSPPTQGASAGQQMPPLGPMQSLPSQPGAMPGGGAGAVDLAGVMQAMQEFQMAAQKLAQGLPPLSPFIAQVLRWAVLKGNLNLVWVVGRARGQ